MFDCHYDLLTYIYINKNNLKGVKKYCNRIFTNNISGGIFNLFYMSLNEMKEELGVQNNELDIINNLNMVNELIKNNNLIPPNINYIYGIEGLDYLNKIEDLDKICKLGVRSINIVWNNDNKFGGGAKGNKNQGLTIWGEELVKKIVDLEIAIDLSHANEKTFYDIIKICKKIKANGKQPKIFASHSNCKTICNHYRNLTDKQILEIKSLNGIIGIAGVKPFCSEEEKFSFNNKKYKNAYLEHIKYLKDLLNGVNNIAVSTDDMGYYKTNKRYYKHFNVFKQYNMNVELEKLLLKHGFNRNEIEKILYKNAEHFFNIN